MTVHKIKTCACGHASTFHAMDGTKRGACAYGRDRGVFSTSVAPCPCLRFHRRASPLAFESTTPPIEEIHVKQFGTLVGDRAAIRAALDTIIDGFAELRDALDMPTGGFAFDADRHLVQPPAELLMTKADRVPPPAPKAPRTPRPQADASDDGAPTKTELAILRVLAARAPRATSRAMVSILSGYSTNSGSFTKAVAGLRKRGWVAPSMPLAPTEAGIEAAQPVSPLPTGKALLDFWKQKLSTTEATLLEAIVAARPNVYSRDSLGKATGYSTNSGSFTKAIANLRAAELVEKRSLALTHDFQTALRGRSLL